MQLETRRSEGAALEQDDAAVLFGSGDAVSGDFRCADCGYGVSVRVTLPVCPMCRGRVWEPPAGGLHGHTPA